MTSILVACYNEEDFIEDKIVNLLNLNYPRNKYEIVFVTDGSDDNTNSIILKYIEQHPTLIKLYYQPVRKGKQHAVNRVINLLSGAFVVFNDCNTSINEMSLQYLMAHFEDPKVGVVTGEKKIIVEGEDKVVSSGEGMYWKYESFLKKMESDFYSTVGSPGELFAIRKSLYSPVPKSISIEDFYLSMLIVLKAYRNVYEPLAYATEYSSLSLRDEFKRKRRIASGAYKTIISLTEIYSIKHLKFLFQYISNRIFRWFVAPIALVLLLISNLNLSGCFYTIVLTLQILFYAIALLGFLFRSAVTKYKFLYIPFYFIFMNFALLAGFYDFISNKNNVIWEKVNRRKA